MIFCKTIFTSQPNPGNKGVLMSGWQNVTMSTKRWKWRKASSLSTDSLSKL